jgi:hypothetical protein
MKAEATKNNLRLPAREDLLNSEIRFTQCKSYDIAERKYTDGVLYESEEF